METEYPATNMLKQTHRWLLVIRTFCFIKLVTLLTFTAALCKDGYLSGRVIIDSDACTIDCPNEGNISNISGVHFTQQISADVTREGDFLTIHTCRFNFANQLVFSQNITNLTIRGERGLSFVASNDDLDVHYPIRVGGPMLRSVKNGTSGRILSAYYTGSHTRGTERGKTILGFNRFT